MNTATTQLFKYLGLSGTSGTRTGSLVPRASTPDAEQRLFREFDDAGRISNPDIWTRFNSVMKRPTTFDSMLQLWDEMSQWDLIAAALVEITDEATQSDANSPGTLWYQCNDERMEDELNDMLARIDVESILASQVWHVAAMGNHFEKIEYAPVQGVMGLSFVHPMDVRRYWLERNRKCVGFRWMGKLPPKDDIFVMPDNRTPVERVAMASGSSTEDLWYPWDFLHFRRMFRMRVSEHGEPVFAEADGVYKKLRIAIDQMVVHRAQIQPDRYNINIDVQEQPPTEQMRTVHRWRQALRSKLAFGQAGASEGLSGVSDFQSFYNAWALDTVVYLAQPKGFNNTMNKFPGTQQIPDVYDIELLTDLFYSIIGMPRAWFGGQRDGGSEAPSGRALLAQDIRFLRKIKGLRRPITQAYTWLGYFHAILKGIDITNLEIKAMMPPIGGLEEEMKMELLEKQAQVLGTLGDIMDKFRLPKEAWVETIFKRYMHLPDDIVHVFLTALPSPIDGEETMGESRTRGRPQREAPHTFQLIREIENKVGKNPDLGRLIRELKDTVYGAESRTPSTRRRRAPRDILHEPRLQEHDVVISSYGRHPYELTEAGRRAAQDAPGPTPTPNPTPLTEGLMGGGFEPYRRWMNL